MYFNKNIPDRYPFKLSNCGGTYQVCHYGDLHVISSSCFSKPCTGEHSVMLKINVLEIVGGKFSTSIRLPYKYIGSPILVIGDPIY